MSETHAPNLVGWLFYFIIIEQQQWRHENGSEQISEQSRARNSKDNGREDGWLAAARYRLFIFPS
jgi:hypothetical protein